MKMQYSMIIQWSEEDQIYIVTLPEFGGNKTHGNTYEEAAKNGQEGWPLPAPILFGSPVPAA